MIVPERGWTPSTSSTYVREVYRSDILRTIQALCLCIGLAALQVAPALAQSAPNADEESTAAAQAPARQTTSPGNDSPTTAGDAPVLDFTAAGPIETPNAIPEQPEPKPAQVVEEPSASASTSEATPVLYGALATPPAVVAPPPKPSMPNSVSLSPIGLVIGRVRLNYERRFADHHGLLVEAWVAPSVLSDFEFVSTGGGLGYRWYWNGSDSSGFVGGHVGFEQGSGRFDTIVDGDTQTYEGRVSQLSIVPVIGKRWLLMPHLVMTLRFGLGYASTRYEPDATADAEAVDQLRDFARQLPITLESEFSLGYRF